MDLGVAVGEPHEPQADVAAIEAAMVAVRRAQSRRRLAHLARRRGERTGAHSGLPDSVFELLDVVEAGAAEGEPPTVTEAAAILDVDQPRASRLAGQAVEAGLLRREADQRDGRRSLLVLTADGRAVLAAIHGFRRRTIAEATSEWDPAEREMFARLLSRFVRELGAVEQPERSREA